MECRICEGLIDPPERYTELGIDTCKPCGQKQALKVKHTIVPLHKGNYIPVTNREDLIGINNKGGLVK